MSIWGLCRYVAGNVIDDNIGWGYHSKQLGNKTLTDLFTRVECHNFNSSWALLFMVNTITQVAWTQNGC